jgi:hypothetical protein
MTTLAARLSAVAVLGVVAAGACTRDAWIGFELPRGSAGNGGRDAGPLTDAGECQRVSCGTHVFKCGDCIDNDDDGKVDMDDPECLGPCQNDETTFANPMAGQGHGSCALDCYFDQDNGSGNDDCEWSHICDPLAVAPDYPPEGPACAYDPNHKLTRAQTCASLTTAGQSDRCGSVCGPLTPNGCDCFGCCDFPGAGTVFIGSVDDAGKPTCDLEHIADPTRCKPCTQVPSCTNHCEKCELCVGKRAPDPGCNTGGSCVAPECGPLLTPCGLECLPECTDGRSCITGCCIEPPR